MNIFLKNKNYLIIIFFIILTAAIIIKKVDISTTKLIVLDYKKLIKTGCPNILTSHHLQLNEFCKTASIKINTSILQGNTIFIISKIKSNLNRSGVHTENNLGWNYSYHNGDGSTQILYNEIKNQNNLLNLHLVFDENSNSKGVVDFYEIIISSSLEELIKEFPEYKSLWARTNNPNKDFWYDRYTSLIKNFTITLPNISSKIWERSFGIGINDRTNSGDYYCFPDDKILILQNKIPNWIYLGLLDWKREILIHNDELIFTFKYKGSLKYTTNINQKHAKSVLNDNFGTDLFPLKESPDIQLQLIKTYTFKPNNESADVTLSATIYNKLSNRFTYYWIVEDAAYMDFTIGNNKEVKSFFEGKENLIKLDFDIKSFQLKKYIQFRTYPDTKRNMASFYSGYNANLQFILDDYFPLYLSKNKSAFNKIKQNQSINTTSQKQGPYVFGIGFKEKNLTLNSKFKLHFNSGFTTPSNL